jgi:hypothetical protein
MVLILNRLVVEALVPQRDIKMTYPMLDHLRLLSEVLTGTSVLLGLGAVFVCLNLLIVHPVPATVRHSA